LVRESVVMFGLKNVVVVVVDGDGGAT